MIEQPFRITAGELLAQSTATCLCGSSFPGTAYGLEYHHSAAGWVECFACRDKPEESEAMKAHSSYVHGLGATKGPPPDEDLRAEEPGKPTVGDLIQPGDVVQTSYNSAPILVDKVTPYLYYERFRAWSVTGFSRSYSSGEFERSEHSRGWINELVVDHSGPEPVIRKLFRANNDTLTVEGPAFAVNKRGQGQLF